MPTVETSSNLVELIRLLNKATDRGTLPWEATPDEDAFRAFLNSGLVKILKEDHVTPGIASGASTPSEEKYTIQILDAANRIIDLLAPATPEESEQLKELFWKVRRVALHLDHLYGALLTELKSRAGQ